MNIKLKTRIASIVLAIAIILSIPVSAFAQDEDTSVINTPVLTSISFRNAVIDQEFDPNLSEYTITLTDPNIAPTLNGYEIDGSAELFINYILNAAGKQTGIKATLRYSNISIDYQFKYSNPPASEITTNKNLGYIECELCEIYPKLNDKETDYTLYIPKDLNEINLSVGTQDPNATCKVPGTLKLNENQNPTIKLQVFAADSSVKIYSLKIERLDLTCDEVRALPDSESIISNKITNERLENIIIAGCVILGILILVLFVIFAKKLTVRVYDEDEKDYFDVEITDKESNGKNE